MRIGIDMGGMSVKLGLVDDDNAIVQKHVIPTRLDVPASDFVEDMIVAVNELIHKANVSISEISGIGIGSPGTIDSENGCILYSNNFGWENVEIVRQMQEKLNVPMAIANDADAAAVGEVYAGAAKGSKSAILITLGTGVGGGVVLNGKVFQGPLHGGLELGHMVIHTNGEPCTCGRKGCFEAYASATALLRLTRNAMLEHPESILYKMCDGKEENVNGKMPFDAAAQGDIVAQQVVETYETDLAEGIANVINIFRPEYIILGGGVSAQKENLTMPLQEKVNSLCFGGMHGEIAKIVTSQLGNDAGIIGAACLL